MTDEFVTDDAQLTGQETGGQLRARLEEQIQRNKALMDEVVNLKNDQAKRAVVETWSKLNVPPKLQAAYLGENSPEAIEKWWGEISPLVNMDGPNVDAAPVETADQREQREQIEHVQKAAALGGEFSSDVESGFAMARELRGRDSAITQAELDDMFRKMGIPK